MTSRSQLGTTLKTFLTEDADRLAQQHGLRRRLFSGALLAQLFVLGWLQRPQAGPSALARFAGTLGLRLTKQSIDAHFTQQTADWLLALLQQAVRSVVCAQAVSLPRLAALSRGAGGRWQSNHVTSRSCRALAGLRRDSD